MEGMSPPPVRRSERVPAVVSVRLLLAWENFKLEHEAHTVDLSALGARIRTPSELSPGETVRLVAWGESGQPLPARVVWMQRTSTGASLAGLEFLVAPPA